MKKQSKKAAERRTSERMFHEAQGRLLEHAYAKGFYEGATLQGAVFIPYVGLICAGQDKDKQELLKELLAKNSSPTGLPHAPTGAN